MTSTIPSSPSGGARAFSAAILILIRALQWVSSRRCCDRTSVARPGGLEMMYTPRSRGPHAANLWLERVVLLAIVDISALGFSSSDRPRTGHLGHQDSQAPGRPILHCRCACSTLGPQRPSEDRSTRAFRPRAAGTAFATMLGWVVGAQADLSGRGSRNSTGCGRDTRMANSPKISGSFPGLFEGNAFGFCSTVWCSSAAIGAASPAPRSMRR